MGMSVGGPKGKVSPEMNITPLVDVVLVLLIIFMVLAPVVAEAFFVRLPPKDATDEKLDAAAADPQQPLVLSVHADDIDVNAVKINEEELATRLHRMFNARPDNLLYLDADDEVNFGRVLKTIDKAREGSASPIVIITKKLK